MSFLRAAVLFVITVMLTITSASCVTVASTREETYYVTEYVTENRTESFSEVVPVSVVTPGEDVLAPCISWSNSVFRFNGIKHVWYYGFDLSGLPSHANEKIKLAFSKQQFYEYTAVSVFDMSARGQLLSPPLISTADEAPPAGIKREMLNMTGDSSTFDNWLNMANYKLNFARFIGGRSDLWLNDERPYTVEFSTRGVTDIAVIISGPSAPQNMRFNAMRSWTDSDIQNVTRSVERPVPYQLEKKVAKQRTVTQSRQAPFWELFLHK